ncbi:MAG: ribonuclease III [bacterium]|nr:ribonuclease III [bacterium]
MGLWSKLKRLIPPGRSSPSDAQLNELERLIGYHFRDRGLLRLSLTHRSVARAAEKPMPSNERLEFLGDSVLGLIIADQLFRKHPDLSEGDLTKQKAMLVNETTLSIVAIEIGLNRFVYVSAEEEKSGGRERPSIVSDAFESIIGAVFLDGGLQAARSLVLDTIYSRKASILADDSQRNYKGDFLEMVQARAVGMPRYEIVSETGPDHDKTFNVVVTVAGEEVGRGTGSSKKEAEQKAAAEALLKMADADE